MEITKQMVIINAFILKASEPREAKQLENSDKKLMPKT